MNRVTNIVSAILAVVFFGAAQASEFATFQRLLEIGEMTEAKAMIPRMARTEGVDPKFFEAHIKFFEQDYAGALDLLSGFPSNDFKKLVQTTLNHSRNFKTVQTDHFSIRFEPGRDEVLSLYAGDVLERAWAGIGTDLSEQPGQRTTVEFYPTWKDFMEVSTLTENEVRTTGTIALCKFNRMSVTTPRATLLGYDWMDTLAHEYTHYLINRASKGLAPVWLHEGIAKYEEVRWRRPTGSEIAPRTLALLSRRLQNGKMIPFEKLHPSIAKLPSAEDAELAFAQVFSFVQFLVEANGGMSPLRDTLHAIGRGLETSKALEKTYGRAFRKLHDDWLTWLKTQNLPKGEYAKISPPYLQSEAADANRVNQVEIQSVQNDQAKKFIRLGDLLSEKQRHRAALSEYEKGRSLLSTPSPFLLNKISLSAYFIGDRKTAEARLSEAIRSDSTYVTSYVRRGMLRLEGKDMEGAEADFLKANSINPFDPQIHLGLSKIYEERKAVSLLERERQAAKVLEQSPR